MLLLPHGTDSKELACWLAQKLSAVPRAHQEALHVLVPHFCSLGAKGPVYHQLIFRVMTALRLRLNLRHKVELVEERLKKYFEFWLELADRLLE